MGGGGDCKVQETVSDSGNLLFRVDSSDIIVVLFNYKSVTHSQEKDPKYRAF